MPNVDLASPSTSTAFLFPLYAFSSPRDIGRALLSTCRMPSPTHCSWTFTEAPSTLLHRANTACSFLLFFFAGPFLIVSWSGSTAPHFPCFQFPSTRPPRLLDLPTDRPLRINVVPLISFNVFLDAQISQIPSALLWARRTLEDARALSWQFPTRCIDSTFESVLEYSGPLPLAVYSKVCLPRPHLSFLSHVSRLSGWGRQACQAPQVGYKQFVPSELTRYFRSRLGKRDVIFPSLFSLA